MAVLPAAIPPAPAVMRILGRFDRQALTTFITVAIDLLDVVEGDPDEEGDGDERDGCPTAEDEFGGFSQKEGLHWSVPIGQCEDDEDDDPGGGNVTDEPHDMDEGV